MVNLEITDTANMAEPRSAEEKDPWGPGRQAWLSEEAGEGLTLGLSSNGSNFLSASLTGHKISEQKIPLHKT